jgi:cytochrome b6-f complex iron-sulfur subunit
MAKEKFIPKASVGSGSDNNISRGKFISVLSLGWVAFIAGLGGFFTALGRMFFPNVSFEPPQEFKIGYASDFEVGKVDLRFKKQYNVWVVRDKNGIYALSTVCTHLGCTPNWLEAEKKFKCPCHGSGFRSSGINFEGPAPRPLERFRIFLAGDGQIIVDKNKKFNYEKGEWNRPQSILKV